jgi:hypothetical protein
LENAIKGVMGDFVAHSGRMVRCHSRETAKSTPLEAVAATNALMRGTHVAGTAAGRVVSTDDGYRFMPEPGY